MLTIYTSTYCRPDYVQLLADCLRATVHGDYRFVVYVQPGGLMREWSGVHEVIRQSRSGYAAWQEILPEIAGPAVIIHDDCVPVLPWNAESFPGRHVIRAGGFTLQYHADGYRQPSPKLLPVRVNSRQRCSARWSDELCDVAASANCESLMDGTFLHIDKGTIGSPACSANAAKPALVDAIARFVGVQAPASLTADELAAHPGRNFKAAVRGEDRTARPGLGDIVAAGLDRVGITKERVQAVASRVGIKDCGCKRRQQRLNELGRKVGIGD